MKEGIANSTTQDIDNFLKEQNLPYEKIGIDTKLQMKQYNIGQAMCTQIIHERGVQQ